MKPIPSPDFQDQLVRGLTHRMNNILTLFHGYLGLLFDNKKLDPETLAGLNKIRDGAKAASELLDRTHSLMRPPAVTVREIDLAEMVRGLKPAFESMATPGTRIEITGPDSLPRVVGDVGRIKAALIEIVRNACEASPRHGQVEITLAADEPAGAAGGAAQPARWVNVMVEDHGPGIAPELLDRVFTPFFSTKKKKSATGLGLTLAQAYVQQHDGALRLESREGCTRVTVLLPARSSA